jgi:hypothetical protein
MGHAGFEHDARHQHRQDSHDLHAVEHRRRILGTVTRLDQLRAQIRRLRCRRGHVGADLVQHRDQRAGLRLGVDRNAAVPVVADHRVAELFEEAPGLVEYAVRCPRHYDHQR